MSEVPDPSARLEALEVHLAHQSLVIEDLNGAVAAQWSIIDGLRRRLDALLDRVESSEARAALPPAQRPPHY